MKFKVGDKVRVIGRTSGDACALHGQICTVKESHGTWLYLKERQKTGVWAKELELVTSEQGCAERGLQELVDKANEGIVALQKLITSHRADIEYKDDETSWESLGGAVEINHKPPFNQVLRIKPSKPKFTPFTTSNGWEVKVDGIHITIGCKVFPIRDFNSEMSRLIDGADRNGILGFEGMKVGIRHGNDLLPWADAERIYNALKEMEK